ncbi:MAG TPA: Crp/Fnr family transcriptional regulator [Treponemataceae bacterium]|nr:Crp/Fnr family transcriptional regulator [Treponemataceae bacterium]
MDIPGNCALFVGIKPEEATRLLSCFGTHARSYAKGARVLHEGDPIDSIGIILAGSVQVTRVDYDGNRAIIAGFGRGEIFAESLACAGVARSPVSVVAVERTDVLFIPYKRMLRPCSNACSFHGKLIENLVALVARKNLTLSEKIEICGKRTTREKVIAYLAAERRRQGGRARVEVPFSRAELADYLAVDRSALSRELSRMRDEGILSFEGKVFEY